MICLSSGEMKYIVNFRDKDTKRVTVHNGIDCMAWSRDAEFATVTGRARSI